MTGQEIAKALRCCAKGLGHDDGCENCKVGEIQNRREYIEFAAANVIERLTAENAALREKVPQWVSVQDRLPEPETDVLIVCNRNGCVFVTPAIYEDGKMLTQESAWNWSDIYGYGLYSEEDDDYYIPEGWWENRQFNPDDVYNNPVDCTVTHWMPLPEAPEEHNGKENS